MRDSKGQFMPETLNITWTPAPLVLALVRDEIDGKPHFVVTLTGDAGTKVIEDTFDEALAEKVYRREYDAYKAREQTG